MPDTKLFATRALRMLFRPIARIMLRAGVNWRELAEVCKSTYVEVATEDFGIRGRPTNISRVAILTGMTRREVRRLRSQLQHEAPESASRMNYASRVLTGWHQDPEFLEENGKPALLPVSGSSSSFESLCGKYSGDVAASTLLKELKHVGAIEENANGELIAKTRYYMPVLLDPEQMLRSGSVLQDIGYTIAHNLHREESDPSRFEGRATNRNIPEHLLPEFHNYCEAEAQEFLEKIDAWLSENEDPEATAEDSVRLGMGAYWIQGR
ncbi:MAG: hypothetical protein KJO31_05655 [Gammaproteobacteria bacterium]|nr:hypothetical protein [Gammaproteobacteria bacterium]